MPASLKQVSRRWPALGLAGLLGAAAVLGLSAGLRGAAQAAVLAAASFDSGAFFFPPYPSDADRMGVAGSVGLYTTTLQAGWYQDWGASANPAQPGGLAYARTIYFTVNTNACGTGKTPASVRSQVTESLTGTALINNLAAHPGAVWIIGNEPDSIYNCSPIQPALYAELFHEFRSFIKAHDPTARVVIAGIVQPSPLRLAYLDQVLAHHQARFGEPLVTDLWNIHLYALPEIAGQAGAGVPPGAASSTGWTTDWTDTVDLAVLADNLRAMRQWLADRGERDKPLIITEFGQLIPDDGSYWLDGLQFTQAVSRDYLAGAVDHFLGATDPAIGYPADGNRLVQLWAWYSLRDVSFGGDLLNLDNSFTLAGHAFAQRGALHYVPYADLYPRPVVTPAIPPGSTEPVTVTLTVAVDNHGNSGMAGPVPGEFDRYDAATGAHLGGGGASASDIPARFTGTAPQVSASWVIAPGDWFTLTFALDPGHTISHARRSPQLLTYTVGYIPDLAVVDVGGLPPVFQWPASGDWPISITVWNTGFLTSEAGTVSLSLFDANDQLVAEWKVAVPALGVGQTKTVGSLVPLAAPGPYALQASVAPNEGPDLSPADDLLAVEFFAALSQAYLPVVRRP